MAVGIALDCIYARLMGSLKASECERILSLLERLEFSIWAGELLHENDDGKLVILDGLEEFSHIIVIYWMHRVSPYGQVPLKVHPGGSKELPLMGIFATRSPHRLNPIGATIVRLLERRDDILKVERLDAIDGTPVIDIKPYIPRYDLENDAKVPSWLGKRKAKNC